MTLTVRNPLLSCLACISIILNCTVVDVLAQCTASYIFTGEAANDEFGNSVSGAGDVNSDGFDDFIIGALRNDAAGFSAGRAYVYSGQNGAILYTFTGETAEDLFGASVSGAGDVDNDGFADLIIGAPFNSFGGERVGRAYVYSGMTGALLHTFTGEDGTPFGDWFGNGVSGAGDVDNDGFDDIIVGATIAGRAYVYSGQSGALLHTLIATVGGNYNWLYSVSGAGDINNDGFDDLIVGTEHNNAFVYSGESGTLLYTFTGETAGDGLGISVSDAGDVNNDGFADVIIGANYNDAGGLDAGRAYVYSGQNGTILHTFTGEAAGDYFGHSVSGAGDVNNDGFVDLIVGADGSNTSSAYVFSGQSGDLLRKYTNEEAGNYFGSSVSGMGDFNNDGFADLIVGAFRGGPGNAYVFSGANIVDGSQLQTPIFLVHGLDSDASIWNSMKTWLESNGHQFVYAVDNLEPCGVGGETNFSGNALLLSQYIEAEISCLESRYQTSIGTINIIGHSMGGLIARRYVSPTGSSWTLKNVDNLVMLGTPNKGSNLSAARIPFWLLKCPSGPAITELSVFSMIVFNNAYPDNMNTNYYSFWGNRGRECGYKRWLTWLSLFKPNDGVVSKNSATRDRDNGWSFDPVYIDNYEGDWCHTGSSSYLEDESLFSSIKQILDPANPFLAREIQAVVSPDIPPQIVAESNLRLIGWPIVSDSFYVESDAILSIALFADDSFLIFSLESPSAIIYDESLPTGDSTLFYYNDSLGAVGFYIEAAQEGYWHWTIDASNAHSVFVEAMVIAGIDNSVILTLNQNLEYLSPTDTLKMGVMVTDNDIGVAGLSVVALPIWNGVDTSLQIALLDDGARGDLLANDGIYGALINSSDSGNVEYKIVASGSAPSGDINRLVSIFVFSSGSCCTTPGDFNHDGSFNIADVTAGIARIFGGGVAPFCQDEGDADGDGSFNIADVTYGIARIFGGGPAPVCGSNGF